MPNNGHHQLAAPPELTNEQVRKLGYHAIVECFEAQAKSHDLIAKSRDLLTRVDELLARDRLFASPRRPGLSDELEARFVVKA